MSFPEPASSNPCHWRWINDGYCYWAQRMLWIQRTMICLPKSISYSFLYSLWHQKAKWETRAKITKRLILLWKEGFSSNWNSLGKKEWPYQGAVRFPLSEVVKENEWLLIKMCWKRRVWLEEMTSKVSTLRYLICLSFLWTHFWSWVRGQGSMVRHLQSICRLG